MAIYYKPQSPIQSGEDFIYPITTADQIMKSDNSRRLEQAGLIVADNSTSLGGKAPEYYIQPRNLLDNSDFRNPVNQRGNSSYFGEYGVDRWRTWNSDTLNVSSGYITVNGRAFEYILPSVVKSTVHTLVAKKTDGSILLYTKNPKDNYTLADNGLGLGLDSNVVVSLPSGDYEWAALYEGSYTAETLPPYVPKGYAVELAACNAAPVDLGGGYGGGSLQAYPVGSIYISTISTSPASLFGGTWEQIKGRFLLGTGAPENNDDGTSPGDYDETTGSKGGEATHKLTTNEIPQHQHGPSTIGTDGVNIVHWLNNSQSSSRNSWGFTYGTEMSGNELYSGYAGGGVSHNNMPPYLAVYMWKRVS